MKTKEKNMEHELLVLFRKMIRIDLSAYLQELSREEFYMLDLLSKQIQENESVFDCGGIGYFFPGSIENARRNGTKRIYSSESKSAQSQKYDCENHKKWTEDL